MAALQERKLQEGLQLLKEAEKFEKTSWLKWKPDWDSAADKYMKAGTCFKTAKSYDRAAEAFKKAADAHSNSNALFHAAKALEQAASVLKEMKNVTEAVSLVERAVEMYRQSGNPDTGAFALIRGAKLCDSSDPAKAAELYILASEMNVSEDKVREAIEPLSKAINLLLKLRRFPEALNVMKQQRKLYEQIENFQMMSKVVLSMVVVHLHESDYVAADNCYKDSFEIPGFGSSDEAVAAEKILDCFDRSDSDGMKSCTSQALFTYLDNEIAKLSRSLRVPGDTGAKGFTERRLVTNLNHHHLKTDMQLSANPVSNSTGQEKPGKEQAIEDELEEGGLC
ncbi:gamma-soluble NSF attachment protein-like [Stylophora pistillata]|uniref:Gamma-soluble NSF attachment protein n=1 Tax=Stylophora pistillata TaxID=50429 RepID=A0A2B4S3S3_STYPI|nr:gamma-soluble NSF attachment protein-like [Stylophora pistillata]PFX23420.1 Gamma-soluble NSF attachment protein [Stylophora pistillata]